MVNKRFLSLSSCIKFSIVTPLKNELLWHEKMESIIYSHNKKMINENTESKAPCNCSAKEKYALDVTCHISDIIDVCDSNGIRTHDDLVHKETINSLAKQEKPVSLNGWVFVYKLSGCGFESRCCHLSFRYRACYEEGVVI